MGCTYSAKVIEKISYLVREAEMAEREVCAKICDERADEISNGHGWTALGAVEECADTIRERSNV